MHAGIKRVVEVLAPLRLKYDFLSLDNPEALLYELRAQGYDDVADVLTDENHNFDRQKFNRVVIAIMDHLYESQIR